MARRWSCPTCGDTIIAPERLRALDARRFCLTCSAKAADNLLVARVMPSKERERAERETAIAERRLVDRQKRAALRVASRADAEKKAERDRATLGLDLRALERLLPTTTTTRALVRLFRTDLANAIEGVSGTSERCAAWVIARALHAAARHVAVARHPHEFTPAMTYELAEREYGVGARGRDPYPPRNLHAPLVEWLTQVQPYHRAIAVVLDAFKDPDERASRHLEKMPRLPRVGAVWERLPRDVLTTQWRHDVPSVAEALKDVDPLTRIYPELLVGPPLPEEV